MIVAHRIQLLPNNAHVTYFRKACGVARVAWNWALGEWERWGRSLRPPIVTDYGDYICEPLEKPKKVRRKGKIVVITERIVYRSLKLTDDYGLIIPPPNGQSLKKEFSRMIDTEWPWMRETTSYAYQRVFPELEQAYKRFFKGLAERPVFKSKGNARDSFYLANTCIKVDGRHVTIQKLGKVRMRDELRFQGKIMSARVSRDADQWFISIAVEMPDVEPVHKTPAVAVGMDLGVAHMAALSTDEFRDSPPRLLDKSRQVKCLQRKLSRQMESAKVKAGIPKNKPIPRGTRIKASRRMLETKRRIQRANQDITGIRSNAQHQLSAELAKRFGVIVVEDLKVKNMTASAKGDAAEPGKKVAQKSGLNRSILNVGFGEIIRQLDYKSKRTGAVLIAVNPRYTSQTCAKCGMVAKENRLSQSVFVCQSCGHTANADTNAARNIKVLGIAKQAEGIVAKEIKRTGKLNPRRKQNSVKAESTGDAPGYARGGSSLEDCPMNRERGTAQAGQSVSGGLCHSPLMLLESAI